MQRAHRLILRLLLAPSPRKAATQSLGSRSVSSSTAPTKCSLEARMLVCARPASSPALPCSCLPYPPTPDYCSTLGVSMPLSPGSSPRLQVGEVLTPCLRHFPLSLALCTDAVSFSAGGPWSRPLPGGHRLPLGSQPTHGTQRPAVSRSLCDLLTYPPSLLRLKRPGPGPPSSS